MKQNKSTPIILALIFAAFLIRLLQIFWVIDFKTGFYESKYTALGIGLTIFTAIMCGCAALLANNTYDIDINGSVSSRVTSVFSGVLSIALLYELFSEKFVIQGAMWQVVLMKIFGWAAACYFAISALARLVNFKMPDISHTVPAFYMIIRIICTFINISSLSLIAENIFLLASYSCALLFFVSYAAYYCTNSYDVRDIYTKLVLASSVCFATSLSNIVANIFAGYTHISLCSQVVLMSVALFLISFTYEKFFKTE